MSLEEEQLTESQIYDQIANLNIAINSNKTIGGDEEVYELMIKRLKYLINLVKS